jgi:molybdopterin biosynthesis enzyme
MMEFYSEMDYPDFDRSVVDGEMPGLDDADPQRSATKVCSSTSMDQQQVARLIL